MPIVWNFRTIRFFFSELLRGTIKAVIEFVESGYRSFSYRQGASNDYSLSIRHIGHHSQGNRHEALIMHFINKKCVLMQK